MMETVDSIGLMPPEFGPTYPNYPLIDQMCRVTSAKVAGTNIYPAVVSQFTLIAGLPALRDREPCYVWEPNNISLQVGQYNCRLMGSFLGLPLYSTNCCPTTSVPSSSSISSSASPTSSGPVEPCGLSTAAKGTNTNTSSNIISISSVTCNTGDVLVVYVARVTSAVLGAGTCKWNNIAMTSLGLTDAGGAPTDLATVGFYLKISSGATGTITYTGPAGTYAEQAIAARTFSGLASGVLDNQGNNTGTTESSPASSGASTFFPCECCIGGLAQYKVGGPTVGTWINGFVSGQTATANIALSLSEAYQFIDVIASFQAAKTGTSQTLWAIADNSFN